MIDIAELLGPPGLQSLRTMSNLNRNLVLPDKKLIGLPLVQRHPQLSEMIAMVTRKIMQAGLMKCLPSVQDLALV